MEIQLKTNKIASTSRQKNLKSLQMFTKLKAPSLIVENHNSQQIIHSNKFHFLLDSAVNFRIQNFAFYFIITRRFGVSVSRISFYWNFNDFYGPWSWFFLVLCVFMTRRHWHYGET